MTEPTDAEIVSLMRDGNNCNYNDEAEHIDYARAVHTAGAAEPVAWLRNTTDPQPHAVTNLKYRSAVDAEAGVEYIPVFAAHQPVAREPLTPEQRTAAFIRAEKKMQSDVNLSWRHALVDEIEAAHGIKGASHDR